MKKLFGVFWKRNLGFFRLAVISNLEYRLNYFSDAILQPVVSTLIEITLWVAVFRSTGGQTIAGFGRENYLSYALWAAFVSRITSSWMYEFKMMDEIESGSVNSIIVRPMSFYEYYLSQFLGYKIVTTVISLMIPVAAVYIFRLPAIMTRIPLALLLVTYYLILVHTISFCVTSTAFFLNKVHSFTVAKNLAIWILSGELFPLDMLSTEWKTLLLNLPFSAAVYVPVGYITGRADITLVWHGFLTTTLGIFFFAALGSFLWRKGMLRYTGTGA